MYGKIALRALTLTALGLLAASMPLFAQDAPSVAEAAKRARQQKQDSAKPTKVITNDEIPGTPAPAPAPAPGDTGAAAPASGQAPAAAPGPAETAKTAAQTADEEAQKKAEIEALTKQVHQMEHDINIQRGAIKLDQDTYYSNPNRPRNDDLKDRIDQEKQSLERMEADLAAVLAKLAELGIPIEAKPPRPRESITSNAPPQQ